MERTLRMLRDASRLPRHLAMSRRGVLITLATATLLTGTTGFAQQNARPDSTACTYDACSLRVEGRQVLRGYAGDDVLTLGTWGAASLAPFVTAPDSAVHYAAEFDRHYTPGTRSATIGALGILIGSLLVQARAPSSSPFDRENLPVVGSIVVSVAVFTYGMRRLDRATRALSRAIWWHNRNLRIGEVMAPID